MSCDASLYLLLQMELGSIVTVTVEYKTANYVLCSCSTIAGVYPAFGIFDAVSKAVGGARCTRLHLPSLQGQLGCIPDSVTKLKPGEQLSAAVLR